MTDKFKQLCDKVGAYEEIEIHRPDDEVCWGNFENSTDFFDIDKNYPPETAEMRERLRAITSIALMNYKVSYLKLCLICHINVELYALVIKLIEEGVLSCEQVKEALSGIN